MRERALARAGRAVTVLIIVALGLIAGALVVVALQISPAPNAGVVPSPTVTVQPTTASPTPSPSAPPPIPSGGASDRLISASDDLIGVRAIRGSCGGSAPTVEVTADGGTTWSGATLPVDSTVGAVLAAYQVSTDQIDLVVQAGPDCATSVLTSFTGGQFWELSSARLGAQSYIDPNLPTSVMLDGVSVPAPCTTPLQVAQSDVGTSVRCSDGIAVYSNSNDRWEGITPLSTLEITWNSDAPSTVIGVLRDPTCNGLAIRAFPADGTAFDGITRGCAPVASDAEGIALTTAGQELWLWADQDIVKSTDGGATWVRP